MSKPNDKKLVIFDLDGVLVDTKDIHFHALNDALKECGYREITYQEHLTTFDGKSTREKLRLFNIPYRDIEKVYQLKQDFTVDRLKTLPFQRNVHLTVATLVAHGYKIAVASNAIQKTVLLALQSQDLIEWVDYVVSNQDVIKGKPSACMYFKCMTVLDVEPENTFIVEDSVIGREAAKASGANLVPINSPSELTVDFVNKFIINRDLSAPSIIRKWSDNTLNVLIPMAGEGSRFAEKGYTFPKPLIEVNRKPMIQVVVDSLGIDANYIYVVREQDYEKYNLQYLFNLMTPKNCVVKQKHRQEGAAMSCMLARELIDNDNPLLIANSDQFIKWNSSEAMYKFMQPHYDGAVLTFGPVSHPKWSFVRTNETDIITEVAEKRVISDTATCGVYFWKKGLDFCRSVDMMVSNQDRVNGEFYVAPSINYLINEGQKFLSFNVDEMWGLGTPEDLDTFLARNGV